MRKTVWLGVLWALGAAAINACGSSGTATAASEGAGDTGAGGGITHTSPTGTGGASTSSSTSASSSTSSSSGAALVNGCDPATAVDHTADADVMVAFGDAEGLKYNPACIKIAQGHTVTFSGSFSSHPLSGGDAGTPDATSPIAATSTGTTATFTFANAGTFPYYCTSHFSSGMQGAVFVE
ncbi:MAG: plastocyanin/azurin family copper-binding protein [Minicystis sp.]